MSSLYSSHVALFVSINLKSGLAMLTGESLSRLAFCRAKSRTAVLKVEQFAIVREKG